MSQQNVYDDGAGLSSAGLGADLLQRLCAQLQRRVSGAPAVSCYDRLQAFHQQQPAEGRGVVAGRGVRREDWSAWQLWHHMRHEHKKELNCVLDIMAAMVHARPCWSVLFGMPQGALDGSLGALLGPVMQVALPSDEVKESTSDGAIEVVTKVSMSMMQAGLIMMGP